VYLVGRGNLGGPPGKDQMNEPSRCASIFSPSELDLVRAFTGFFRGIGIAARQIESEASLWARMRGATNSRSCMGGALMCNVCLSHLA
jgi:hypothetical protein